MEKWREYDATELIKKWKGDLDILLDVVGVSDSMLKEAFADRMDLGNGGQVL